MGRDTDAWVPTQAFETKSKNQLAYMLIRSSAAKTLAKKASRGSITRFTCRVGTEAF